MNPLEFQLSQLVKLMNQTKLDYALMGGLAVSIYGEPRFTLDMDVNVILKQDSIDDFLKEAKRYGFYPIPKNIKRFVKKTLVIPMRFSKNDIYGRIDFIIAYNDLEYSGIKRASLKKVYSCKVRVIRPEDLIIHKITSSRPKDIDDIKGILIRQKGKLNIGYIKDWLKKIEKINPQAGLLKLFENLYARI